MSHSGDNIYLRQDGRWEGRYVKSRIDGKVHYGYVYGKSYEEVVRKLPHIVQDSNYETLVRSCGSSSFKCLADEWLSVQQRNIKESSYVKYKNILSLYLLPKFGDYMICNIERSVVIDYACNLLVDGGMNESSLSPKTVSCIISVLKSILAYASNEKKYTTADVSNLPIKTGSKQMILLSVDEQQCLTEYLLNHPCPRNLGILLSLYAGLRIGEVCALKWGDIGEQDVYVHNTMQRIQTFASSGPKSKIIITPPKSACSIRRIPLPDLLFPVLQDCRLNDSCFLLSGTGDKSVEPRNLENYFKRVLERCGIRHTNYHVLRHTFATRCVELGFDVKSLSEILGHANVNITLNRYVHPSMELKKKNMNMLCTLLTAKSPSV